MAPLGWEDRPPAHTCMSAIYFSAQASRDQERRGWGCIPLTTACQSPLCTSLQLCISDPMLAVGSQPW
jgi:hypothetical protein